MMLMHYGEDITLCSPIRFISEAMNVMTDYCVFKSFKSVQVHSELYLTRNYNDTL
jgi:hypothetical protein